MMCPRSRNSFHSEKSPTRNCGANSVGFASTANAARSPNSSKSCAVFKELLTKPSSKMMPTFVRDIALVSRLFNHALITEQAAQRGILQHCVDRRRLAIHEQLPRDQAHAMRVIDIGVAVHDGERLNRISVELSPAIDRDAVRFFLKSIG